jgi:hypothetical protein
LACLFEGGAQDAYEGIFLAVLTRGESQLKQ